MVPNKHHHHCHHMSNSWCRNASIQKHQTTFLSTELHHGICDHNSDADLLLPISLLFRLSSNQPLAAKLFHVAITKI